MKHTKLISLLLLFLALTFVNASSLIWPPEYQGYISMSSHSHGGGYNPYYNEFWMPGWSSSNTVIYRYDEDYNYLGYFYSGQSYVMQLWGDTDGSYYTANWGNNTITKRTSMTDSTTLWSYNLGSTAGGVTADENYVYAMRHGNATLYVLNKDTGSLVKTLTLTGGGTPTSTLYGGLAVVDGYLLRGNAYGGYIDRYNLSTGEFIDSFYTGYNIYGSMFDGENYYIHQNDSTIEYYTVASAIPEINSMLLVFVGIALIFIKYVK